MHPLSPCFAGRCPARRYSTRPIPPGLPRQRGSRTAMSDSITLTYRNRSDSFKRKMRYTTPYLWFCAEIMVMTCLTGLSSG
ncbi:hypothetical protein SFOMI_4163 [Sphingobium fuliginis]|uniref:Uncharacterized protein n=1 Tax=Sphingobium fuliginis (strain ATCC 27551) TaxID=336203 RepID=A0A292ZL86_SPHSA|nr:hypothetical protein SFOMI_4163 [Sphingobium fuliginis]